MNGINSKRDQTTIARYSDPNGKQTSKTFKRKTDADRFLRDMEVAIDRAQWINPRNAEMSIAQRSSIDFELISRYYWFMARLSTRDLRRMLNAWITTAQSLSADLPRSPYDLPKVSNAQTSMHMAAKALRDTELQKNLCAAFNSLSVTPRKIMGSGGSKIVFDIGGGRVARFSFNSQMDEQEGGDNFKAIRSTRAGSGLLEVMNACNPASLAESRFMQVRLLRRGFEWLDPGPGNLGRDPETGKLGVFDGVVIRKKRELLTAPQIHMYELRKPSGLWADAKVPLPQQKTDKNTYVAEYWNGQQSAWLAWNLKSNSWKPARGMGRFFESESWTKSAVLLPILNGHPNLSRLGVTPPRASDFPALSQSIA